MKARVKARSSSELPVKNEITISNYGSEIEYKNNVPECPGIGHT